MQLPVLALKNWESTKMTLHLFMQIVGKIKLKKMPRKNHWWNITLQVYAQGITTNTILDGDEAFEIRFNFVDHQLQIITSSGMSEAFELKDGLTVADFYQKLLQLLDKLKIEVQILDRPYSLPDENPITIAFNLITTYASYDKEYIERFRNLMLWVNNVFTEFSGRFYGKTCPVQIYWHHMDLAVTRFSGKKLPLPAEMSTSNKDAYSHEVISFGFWVGDKNVAAPAFYCYAYPAPEGLEKTSLLPKSAQWQTNNGSPMALLMYDDIRTAANPKKQLLDFLESAYVAGATLANWDIENLTVPALKDL